MLHGMTTSNQTTNASTTPKLYLFAIWVLAVVAIQDGAWALKELKQGDWAPMALGFVLMGACTTAIQFLHRAYRRALAAT